MIAFRVEIITFKIEGHDCHLFGSGYNCPALKLYGYYTEQKLKNAIKRETKKRTKTK